MGIEGPEMATEAIVPAWNQEHHFRALETLFAGQAISPAYLAVFQEVYGRDYVAEVQPLNYTGLDELRQIAAALRVGPGQVFVDLGCGRGGPGLWVARETGARLVGMDMVPLAVEAARSRAADFGSADATFEIANIGALPFADGSFDAAMSMAVFWMVPNLGRAFIEIARVMRPGARLAFMSGDRTTSPPSAPPPVPDHRPLLEVAGFDIVSYGEVPGAEARRRRVYELFLERRTDLEREMGAEATAVVVREAERALGVYDGVDHIANSRSSLP